MAYSVLVVEQHPLILANWIGPLRDVGYDVTAATSFEEARERLAASPPNLVIASSRLGGYNGLHLVVCGYVGRRTMAIVTTPARDPVLEAEATAVGAACVVAPENRAERIGVVSRAFQSRPM
jgi:DNA-binding NtrC family response regulator